MLDEPRCVDALGLRGYTGTDAGVIQLVECQLPKLDVVGSSPIARSITDWQSSSKKRPLRFAWGPFRVKNSVPSGPQKNGLGATHNDCHAHELPSH